MPQTTQIENVLLALGKAVNDLQTEVAELREAYISLQKGLVNAFRETGFDFSKIGQIEPCRRTVVDLIAEANAILNPEEIDPEVQNELALKVLKLEADPRALVTEASNKGRKQ